MMLHMSLISTILKPLCSIQVSKERQKMTNDDISLYIRMTHGSDISNWTNAYDDVSYTFDTIQALL